jgi:arginase
MSTTLTRPRSVPAVGVPLGAGAPDVRCKNGPQIFRGSVEQDLQAAGMALAWHTMPPSLCKPAAPIEAVSSAANWLGGKTHVLTAWRQKFIVIGGDHSCAIGTWSGVSAALRPKGPIGLVWVDAHMDMHVPETTPTGAIHGMSLAALLGYGAPALTRLFGEPAIDPSHLCLVGVRSHEPEEDELATRLGVRVIRMDEVRGRGLRSILQEAKLRVTAGTIGYGVSLDLDAVDPADAPGVGTPELGGIKAAQFLDSWSGLVRDPRCVAIEMAEYNPARDIEARTARLMRDLIMTAFGPGGSP